MSSIRLHPPTRLHPPLVVLAFAVAATFWAARPVLGQRIVAEPVTGDYLATVYNDDLQPVQMRIVPADKITAVATVTISRAGAVHEYLYLVEIPQDSPQGLSTLRVPCPGPREQFDLLVASATPDGGAGPWVMLHGTYPHGAYCVSLGGVVPLEPGGVLEAGLRTRLLPALGSLQMVGAGAGLDRAWPTYDPIPENDEIRAFLATVNGILEGWRDISSVVPTRDPGLFQDHLGGLALIQGDVVEVCAALGWIPNQGICTSLGAKLGAAAQGLAGGRIAAARGSLRAVLQELEAQHGEEPGKHVDDNAYWLLRINVEYLLSVLPLPPLPTVWAALNPVADKSLKHNKGTFEVAYACEEGTVTSATVNDVEVQDGDVVELTVKSEKSKKGEKSKKSKKSGKSRKSLKLEGASFELVVVCENESGAVTATASPVFPPKSTRDRGRGD